MLITVGTILKQAQLADEAQEASGDKSHEEEQ
jgi:hypothetical protein